MKLFALVFTIFITVSMASLTPTLAESYKSMAPKGAEVYFIAPADGATISGPVVIKFGLKGMGVAPAGVKKKNTGHHHLIIDARLTDFNASIPKDQNFRHFGGGQTQTTVKLAPGKHTLQLVLGDHNHIPHDKPVMSKTITITVK